MPRHATPNERIRRLGYTLMSWASVGMFTVGLWSLIKLATAVVDKPFEPATIMLTFGLSGIHEHTFSSRAAWALIQHAGIWLLAFGWPLIELRRLGKVVHGSEPLSLAVAKRFRWLAHSLVGCLCLGWLADSCVRTAAKLDGLQFSTGLSFSTMYTLVIASMCLYIVAHLMTLAVAAAEDSRSIV